MRGGHPQRRCPRRDRLADPDRAAAAPHAGRAPARAGISHRPSSPTLSRAGRRRSNHRQGAAVLSPAAELFEAHTTGLPGGPFTLHPLRHSALTHAAEAGASAPMLMALSGHTSVRSLAIYARVSAEALGDGKPSAIQRHVGTDQAHHGARDNQKTGKSSGERAKPAALINSKPCGVSGATVHKETTASGMRTRRQLDRRGHHPHRGHARRVSHRRQAGELTAPHQHDLIIEGHTPEIVVFSLETTGRPPSRNAHRRGHGTAHDRRPRRVPRPRAQHRLSTADTTTRSRSPSPTS